MSDAKHLGGVERAKGVCEPASSCDSFMKVMQGSSVVLVNYNYN